MATTMTYGAYSFSPVPLMQISIENQKTRDGTLLGQTFRVTLDGTVTPLPGAGSYISVDALQDSLITGLAGDGRRFYVTCGESDILDVYPRINAISFEPTSDNWVNTADYTVELEFDCNAPSGTPPYVHEASEEWVLEFAEDRGFFSSDLSTVTTKHINNYYALDASPYVFRMTHSLSAVGKSHYSGPGVSGSLDRAGWREAQAYVLDRLGSDNTVLHASGVVNLNVNQFQYYNHFRNQQINELDGSFGVTESWVVINPSGSGVPGNVLENFNTEVRKSYDSDLTTVTINGNIEGLATIDYGTGVAATGFNISESKYGAAQSGWATIQKRLLPRAQLISQSLTTRPLNSGVRTTAIAHNPIQGTIAYNYEYDDRPSNCITGALFESITVVDTYPTDVFSSLTILGRAAGPILQDIGTVTAPSRNVSIEAIMSIGSGCSITQLLANKPTTQVEALLCAFEADLSGTYDTLFLQNDNENWNPKTGQYSRNVTWTYTNCTTAPNTTFCG